jgi:hypothetical protein
MRDLIKITQIDSNCLTSVKFIAGYKSFILNVFLKNPKMLNSNNFKDYLFTK